MPTVSFDKKRVIQALGDISDAELADRIAMIGTDLEDISADTITVEIFPNRPDMLSEEGFIHTIKNFIGKGDGYKDINKEASDYELHVDPVMANVRPYTVAAVVREISLDDESLRSLIQLQEKLDITYCRKRKKAAIGIYPLEKISWPIRFTAAKPEEITFTPLGAETMDARRLLEEHPTGRQYAHLLEGLPLYPYFVDEKGSVLSVPPIINSEETGRVSAGAQDLFIEVSGFHKETLERVLAIILFTLQEAGGTVYEVTITYPDSREQTPNMTPRHIEVSEKYVKKLLDLTLTSEQYARLLARMGHTLENGKVRIASYRTDIHHPIDIIEDIAIAYGYENFTAKIPQIATLAEENPQEVFKRRIIDILIGLGFQETATYHLIGHATQKDIAHADGIVAITNPMNLGYDSLRTNMIVSLLGVLSSNRHTELPRKIFEIGRVFRDGAVSETGVAEHDELGVLLEGLEMTFTEAKQITETIIKRYGLRVEYRNPDNSEPLFFSGRCAQIIVNAESIGIVGEISPDALHSSAVFNPVAGLAINIDRLFTHIKSV